MFEADLREALLWRGPSALALARTAEAPSSLRYVDTCRRAPEVGTAKVRLRQINPAAGLLGFVDTQHDVDGVANIACGLEGRSAFAD